MRLHQSVARGEQLTVSEARRAVVDVGEGDADGGGPRQTPHLPRHVLGLDHHLVLLLHLPVHAWQGRLDGAFKEGNNSRINFVTAASATLSFYFGTIYL